MSLSPTGGRTRLLLLGRFGLALFIILALRISWVQIVEHDQHVAAGQKQHKERVRYLPHRGRILDRNGTPLAYTLDNPTVVAEPRRLADPARRREIARALSPILDMPEAELDRLMTKRTPTVELNRKPIPLPTEVLEKLSYDGIQVNLKPKRFYPLGEAAAHVTGFVGMDQEGIEGVEKAFDRELQGTPGWRTFRRDAHGGRHPFGYEKPAVAGNDLVLTIDATIQELAMSRLQAAVLGCRARGGWALVLDPATGDILAMANVPTYDPTFFERSPVAHFRNHILADRIEPGSTIKAVTVAAALEEGVVRPETPINCMNGKWVLHGKPITDHEKFGVLPFVDTFVHSSNVAMAQIGMKLGAERMYHYLKKFGFGEKAGVGLPGEDSGYLKRRELWSARTPATVAFGYEVQVTPLQMALAYGALANDGVLMKPRLIRAVLSPEGRVVAETEPAPVRRVVTPQTAERLLEFMGKVVEEGTGKQAALDWCYVGGKTGTARKVDPVTKRYISKHYASFIGVAPLDHPRLLAYVVIDEPRGNIYGGSTAAPAFREIVEAAGKAPHPFVRPDFVTISSREPATAPVTALRMNPAVQSDSVSLALEVRALAAPPAETPPEAVDASPDSSSAAHDSLVAGIAASREPGVPVPDLTGLTLREALRRLTRAGLAARIAGAGVVVSQVPAPGQLQSPDPRRPVMILLGDRAHLPAPESR